MSFPVYKPSAITTVEIATQIPADFRDDHWVVYHGTSGFQADIIEREGFDPKKHFDVKGLIDRVVKVYEEIGWWGEHRNGFPVLKSFSSFDYEHGSDGAVFFAIHPNQALLYATDQFHGGEKATALRLAIEDLRSRLKNAEKGMDDLSDANVALIQDFFSETDDTGIVAHKAQQSTPGVLFAVRLTDKHLPYLDYNGHMGLMSSSLIAPEHICMKLIVPPGCRWGLNSTSLAEAMRLSPVENQLFAAMHNLRRAKIT
ncbi:hypothetical protein [Paracoccus sp. SSK6]|uniref:hypothetical protein n=1 Tax=Paracoccus sp. SSK6 TaxID=3143131 RepID=UPI00321ACB28